MRVLVIDIEATCWQGGPPEGQYSEIIEIGMATVFTPDYGGELITAKLHPNRVFVQPRVSTVSEFCYRLTGITPERLLAEGRAFRDAAEVVRQVDYDLWASWGYYDLDMLERECSRQNVSMPVWKSKHLNVKTLHAAMRDTRPKGLKRALSMENMSFYGDQHRGGDDAYNTARILKALLQPALTEAQ